MIMRQSWLLLIGITAVFTICSSFIFCAAIFSSSGHGSQTIRYKCLERHKRYWAKIPTFIRFSEMLPFFLLLTDVSRACALAKHAFSSSSKVWCVPAFDTVVYSILNAYLCICCIGSHSGKYSSRRECTWTSDGAWHVGWCASHQHWSLNRNQQACVNVLFRLCSAYYEPALIPDLVPSLPGPSFQSTLPHITSSFKGYLKFPISVFIAHFRLWTQAWKKQQWNIWVKCWSSWKKELSWTKRIPSQIAWKSSW